MLIFWAGLRGALSTVFAIIAMVIRGEENIIPDGKTVIREDDVVVMYQQ